MPEQVPLTDPMVSSSSRLLSDAMAAWVSKDHVKVLMLAPIAVEHLCKAALWNVNPVLLAQLDKNHEKTFIALATRPNSTDPSLRTIGLGTALSRVALAYESPSPLDNARTRRLVECRGGAVHVGQFNPENAERVLADVLRIVGWLAPLMSIEPRVLHGIYHEVAVGLLDRRRSRKQRTIDRRIAQAQDRFMRLVESVGPQLLVETTTQKELLASSNVPRLLDDEAVAVGRTCPACNHDGLLMGELETDDQVEIEYTRDGIDYNVGWDYYLTPDSYYCNVCGFALNDSDELAMCDLPASKFKLEREDITDALIEYAQELQAWLRESEDLHYDGS